MIEYIKKKKENFRDPRYFLAEDILPFIDQKLLIQCIEAIVREYLKTEDLLLLNIVFWLIRPFVTGDRHSYPHNIYYKNNCYPEVKLLPQFTTKEIITLTQHAMKLVTKREFLQREQFLLVYALFLISAPQFPPSLVSELIRMLMSLPMASEKYRSEPTLMKVIFPESKIVNLSSKRTHPNIVACIRPFALHLHKGEVASLQRQFPEDPIFPPWLEKTSSNESAGKQCFTPPANETLQKRELLACLLTKDNDSVDWQTALKSLDKYPAEIFLDQDIDSISPIQAELLLEKCLAHRKKYGHTKAPACLQLLMLLLTKVTIKDDDSAPISEWVIFELFHGNEKGQELAFNASLILLHHPIEGSRFKEQFLSEQQRQSSRRRVGPHFRSRLHLFISLLVNELPEPDLSLTRVELELETQYPGFLGCTT